MTQKFSLKADYMTLTMHMYLRDRYSAILQNADEKIMRENVLLVLQKNESLEHFYEHAGEELQLSFILKTSNAFMFLPQRKESRIQDFLKIIGEQNCARLLARFAYENRDRTAMLFNLVQETKWHKYFSIERFQKRFLENLRPAGVGRHPVEGTLDETIDNYQEPLLESLKIVFPTWFEGNGFDFNKKENKAFMERLFDAGFAEIAEELIKHLKPAAKNSLLFLEILKSNVPPSKKMELFKCVMTKIDQQTLSSALRQRVRGKDGFQTLAVFADYELLTHVKDIIKDEKDAPSQSVWTQSRFRPTTIKPLEDFDGKSPLLLAAARNQDLEVLKTFLLMDTNHADGSADAKTAAETTNRKVKQAWASERTIHQFIKWRKFNLSPEMIEFVRKNFSEDLNARNAQGQTPLMLLVKHGVWTTTDAQGRQVQQATKDLLEQFVALVAMGARIETIEDAVYILRKAMMHPDENFPRQLFSEVKKLLPNVHAQTTLLRSIIVSNNWDIALKWRFLRLLCPQENAIDFMAYLFRAPAIVQYFNNNIRQYDYFIRRLDQLGTEVNQQRACQIFLRRLAQQVIRETLAEDVGMGAFTNTPAELSYIFLQQYLGLQEELARNIEDALSPQRAVGGRQALANEIHKRALKAGAAFPR